MGQFESQFLVKDSSAVAKQTNPNKPNWITLHAIAAELSIAETERLWLRFHQLGCNKDGDLTTASVDKEENAFSRAMLKKFMGSKKKVTFENFLRGLKWFETVDLQTKLRAVFYILSSGKNLKKDAFTKILEKVYTNPDDKKNLPRVSAAFFGVIDTDSKDGISEEEFVSGVMRVVPEDVTEEILRFEILPNDMREKLYSQLPEIATPPSIHTPGMEVTKTPYATMPKTPYNGTVPPKTANTIPPKTANTLPPQTANTLPPQTANSLSPSRITEPPKTADIPSDEQLKKLADKMHKRDWEKTANKLGLTKEETDEIRKESSKSPQQAFLMLQTWKRRDGTMAKTSVLEAALKDSGLQDLTPIASKTTLQF